MRLETNLLLNYSSSLVQMIIGWDKEQWKKVDKKNRYLEVFRNYKLHLVGKGCSVLKNQVPGAHDQEKKIVEGVGIFVDILFCFG